MPSSQHGGQRHTYRRALLLTIAFVVSAFGPVAPVSAVAAPTPSAADSPSPNAAKPTDGQASDQKAADQKTADQKTADDKAPGDEPTSREKTAAPSEKPSGGPPSVAPSPEPSRSSEPSAPSETPTATNKPIAAETPTTVPPSTTSPEPGRAGGIAPKVVPPANGNNAVITVKVGGNRTTQTAIGNLAGVQLGLYANADDTSPVTGFGTCTSDAGGDCSFTVPNTQSGGANRNKRY